MLTHPIVDAHGVTAGLVLVATDLQKLQRRVLGSLPSDAVVTAFDAQGRTAMRSRDFEQWAGRPAPAQPFAGARARRQGSGTVEGIDGVRRLYAYAPVPKADWLVVVGMLEADVFAEQRALQLRSAAVGLGALALTLLLAWRVSRAVVHPIQGLAETAIRVARGDTKARATPSGPDEIRDVARQFNHMLDVRDHADEQRAHAEAALDQSRDRYLAIVENALDAVVQMDAAGKITGWNARAQTLFGWSAEQAIGRLLQETIIPPRFREAHRRGLARFAASGSGRMLDRLVEIDAQHRDGHTFPVELTITVLKIDSGNEFTAFIRDISSAPAVRNEPPHAGGAAARIAEAGGRRHPGRRHRPRLQQHPGRDPRQRRAGARRTRAGPSGGCQPRTDPEGGDPCAQPGAADPRLQPAPAAAPLDPAARAADPRDRGAVARDLAGRRRARAGARARSRC